MRRLTRGGLRRMRGAACQASALGAALTVGELVVLEGALVGAPRELELAQAVVAHVRAPEVERVHAGLAAPADGLEEEEVIGPLAERRRVRGAVLVDQRPVERQEHGGGDRTVAVAHHEDEAQVLGEEIGEAQDEAPGLGGHTLTPTGADVQLVELRQRGGVGVTLDREALALGASRAAQDLRSAPEALYDGVRVGLERDLVQVVGVDELALGRGCNRRADLERNAERAA
jgi:hypothetical protein